MTDEVLDIIKVRTQLRLIGIETLLIRLRSAQPPVSLRLGHARGKTTLSCFLRPSRRFATHKRRLIKFTLLCVGLCFVTDVFIGSLREGRSP